MAGKILQFVAWVVVILFMLDFVYSAMNQGRHLHQAFKYRKKRRP